jgi:hypothetical protein
MAPLPGRGGPSRGAVGSIGPSVRFNFGTRAFQRSPWIGSPFIGGVPYLYYSPFYSPFNSPFYSNPYFGPAESSPTVAVYTNPQSDLTTQVERLTDEVSQLREQLRQSQAAAQQPSRTVENPAPAVIAPSTVLVFRDGHREEIQSYAIVGRVLWALTEQEAKQISLDDLNLEETDRVNRARGVRFLGYPQR